MYLHLVPSLVSCFKSNFPLLNLLECKIIYHWWVILSGDFRTPVRQEQKPDTPNVSVIAEITVNTFYNTDFYLFFCHNMFFHYKT